ncbi:hypothetical protein Agub_g9684, partial [Astrephomene gubernaculifera]
MQPAVKQSASSLSNRGLGVQESENNNNNSLPPHLRPARSEHGALKRDVDACNATPEDVGRGNAVAAGAPSGSVNNCNAAPARYNVVLRSSQLSLSAALVQHAFPSLGSATRHDVRVFGKDSGGGLHAFGVVLSRYEGPQYRLNRIGELSRCLGARTGDTLWLFVHPNGNVVLEKASGNRISDQQQQHQHPQPQQQFCQDQEEEQQEDIHSVHDSSEEWPSDEPLSDDGCASSRDGSSDFEYPSTQDPKNATRQQQQLQQDDEQGCSADVTAPTATAATTAAAAGPASDTRFKLTLRASQINLGMSVVRQAFAAQYKAAREGGIKQQRLRVLVRAAVDGRLQPQEVVFAQYIGRRNQAKLHRLISIRDVVRCLGLRQDGEVGLTLR